MSVRTFREARLVPRVVIVTVVAALGLDGGRLKVPRSAQTWSGVFGSLTRRGGAPEVGPSYMMSPRKEALRFIHRMATIPRKFLSAAAVCRSIALGPLGLSTVTETVPQLPHAYVLT